MMYGSDSRTGVTRVQYDFKGINDLNSGEMLCINPRNGIAIRCFHNVQSRNVMYVISRNQDP